MLDSLRCYGPSAGLGFDRPARRLYTDDGPLASSPMTAATRSAASKSRRHTGLIVRALSIDNYHLASSHSLCASIPANLSAIAPWAWRQLEACTQNSNRSKQVSRRPLTHRDGVCRGAKAKTPGQTRIRDLELLLVLHEEGNMTRAATRVGISEPALSKQLWKLEARTTALDQTV
jgi:hypothetical protein